MKPVYDEVEQLNKALKSIEFDTKNHPLNELIIRLTKTARRHNLDTKANIRGSECVVGTNHQGLGIEGNYSSQLSPVYTNGQYGGQNRSEQMIRDILFNEEVVIDLTATIKKSNQKTLLRIIKILRKHKLDKAFKDFKESILSNVEIPIADSEHKIVLELDRNFDTTFNLYNKDDNKIAVFEVGNNDDGKPSQTLFNESDEMLSKISKHRHSDTNINEIKTGFLMSQHKDIITTTIQDKTALLNGVVKAYKQEHSELNKLLTPFLAFEKL